MLRNIHSFFHQILFPKFAPEKFSIHNLNISKNEENNQLHNGAKEGKGCSHDPSEPLEETSTRSDSREGDGMP